MYKPERIRKILWTLKKLLGYFGYKKFIVLTRSRTGSNMLVSMLNSHPSICAKGEIFVQLKGRSVEEVLSSVYSKYPRSIKAVGFKIFYYHPVDDQKSNLVWNELMKIEDLYVIHLKRKNILRSELSREIARATNVWKNKSERNDKEIQIEDKQVYLKKEELCKRFEETREWELSYEAMFEGKTMMDIYYEDLIDSPQSEFQKITDFLNLGFFLPTTSLKKQNPEKFSDLIVDYESLKRDFTDTEWSSFFED